jgi:hypothetical protein
LLDALKEHDNPTVVRKKKPSVRTDKPTAPQRVDSEWRNSITKGSDGVQEKLRIRLNSNDSDHFSAARALSQIIAHPEEVNFRRIRRDTDSRRYNGEKELLATTDFVLGALDDVTCCMSKEPSIEKDIDGWSEVGVIRRVKSYTELLNGRATNRLESH